MDAGAPAVGAAMTSNLPAFHARALEAAEETVIEAIAAREAADRLLIQIDELITPPPPASHR